MDFQKLLLKIAKILNKKHIFYAVTGGYAVSIWGRPRSTFDLDIVIGLFKEQIPDLAFALRKIKSVTYIDDNMIYESIKSIGEFNLFHGGSGIKVDFWVVGKDSFSKSCLKRRRPIRIGKEKIYFISPEDLILSKLRWYQITPSSRQLEDVESIFKISKGLLDIPYLKKWAKKLNVSKLLSGFLDNNINP